MYLPSWLELDITDCFDSISISVIYALARKTSILQDDPFLWFSMMLMPCGPPAFVISGLADLAGVPESEEIEIAKSLTVS